MMLQMFKSLSAVLRKVPNATRVCTNRPGLLKVVRVQSKIPKSTYSTMEVAKQKGTEVRNLDAVFRRTKEGKKKSQSSSFDHPYLANLVKSVPFVPFNKDRITRRNFEWQNKFVASTTGPLVANLNRMWRLFRQQNIRQQEWSLFHITGGPGVGKSRYGAEMLHSLKTSELTVDPLLHSLITEAADKEYYAFVHMTSFCGNFIRDGKSIPKLIIAKLLDLDLDSIPGAVKVSDLAKFLNHVLRPATASNPLLLQVHIDELQSCLGQQDLWMWGSLLHKIISGFMEVSFELAKYHIFMIVVTSGSLDLSLKESYSHWDFPIQKLVLEPISDENAIELLATCRKFDPQSQAFQRLVKAQGGLLRLLERLDELLAKYPNDSALRDNLPSIWERQVQIATSLYPPPPEEILELALTGKKLGENTHINTSPFYAWEINGISIDKFKLFYPFVLICAWSSPPMPLAIFRAPTLPMTITSANFKQFAAWYSALLEKRNDPSFDKNLPREEVLKYLSPSLSYLREVDVTPIEVNVTVDQNCNFQ